MKTSWDVIVIGAGPSGLSCATALANQGLATLLLDEQPDPGGQIYRHIETQSEQVFQRLGEEYRYGLALVRQFRNSDAAYLPESVVWNIEHDGRVCFSNNGESSEVKGKRVVIATGAMERPAPFPGWTLPGVAGAGAIDSFLKRDNILPEGPVTLVGSGPLLLQIATHLHEFGVRINGLFETTPAHALFSALPALPQAVSRSAYLLKGVRMLLSARKGAGLYRNRIIRYLASGDGRVERFTATNTHNREFSVETGNVLVHEGIISRTEFSRQLRLRHSWDSPQRYWYPEVDRNYRTSSAQIYMVGDGAYVHGAVAAEIKGEIAACAIISELLQSSIMEKRRGELDKKLRYELAPRAFVDALYSPRSTLYDLADETIVCRCEEVSAGQIRKAVANGSSTPEQVKAFTRTGMGPCQGRVCSLVLAEVVAAETGAAVATLSLPTVRPPVRNIGLSELAKMSLLPEEENR